MFLKCGLSWVITSPSPQFSLFMFVLMTCIFTCATREVQGEILDASGANICSSFNLNFYPLQKCFFNTICPVYSEQLTMNTLLHFFFFCHFSYLIAISKILKAAHLVSVSIPQSHRVHIFPFWCIIWTIN